MKATILLIDDYPGIRDSVGDNLRSQGYEVFLASNGREALNALRDTGFDLVLLDLELPVVSGWDTLVKIVTVSLSLPVIIITERPGQPWPDPQKGVAAFLERPLDLNLLLEVMEREVAKMSVTRRQPVEAEHISSTAYSPEDKKESRPPASLDCP